MVDNDLKNPITLTIILSIGGNKKIIEAIIIFTTIVTNEYCFFRTLTSVSLQFIGISIDHKFFLIITYH